MGLHAVEKYVDKMGGDVRVESKEGEGSCFTVTLPFIITQEGMVSPPGHDQGDVGVFSTFGSESHQEESLDKKVVLLVEDDKVAAIATRMNLSKLNCEVDWAQSGEEALEKVANKDYSLVFMDIGLPEKSGIETAAEIRKLDGQQKASVPIVALTGHARGKIRKLCLNAGMQSVISKPAEVDELKKALIYFASEEGTN